MYASAHEPAPSMSARLLIAIAALLLVAGVGVRLQIMIASPSLWLDEAMLALNVGYRSFAETLGPQDFGQSAPPLFLWLVKGLTVVLGMSEPVLRLLPLLCGFALIPAIFVLARRVAGQPAAVASAAIVALSPVFIRYSTEFKPYISDALIATTLLLIAIRSVAEPGRRWLLLLAVGGAAAVWASSPVVFVLAGIGAVLLFDERIRRAHLTKLLGAYGLWLISFATVYMLDYRFDSASEYLQDYWNGYFLDQGLVTSARLLVELVAGASSAIFFGRTAFPDPTSPLRLAAVAAGVAAVAWGPFSIQRRSGWQTVSFLVLPIMMGIAASVVGAYPVTVRLWLFAAPSLVVLAAAGAVDVGGRVSGMSRWGTVGVVACGVALLLPGSIDLADRIRHPSRLQEPRPLVYRALEEPQRPVYVYGWGFPTWVYYTTDWRNPERDRLDWATEIGDPTPSYTPDPASLARPFRTSVEVIGSQSSRFVAEPGASSGASQEQWAAAEASRFAGHVADCSWLFATHIGDGSEMEAILRELGELGHEVEERWSERGSVLALACRPAEERASEL